MELIEARSQLLERTNIKNNYSELYEETYFNPYILAYLSGFTIL